MIRVFRRNKHGHGFWYNRETGHRIGKPFIDEIRTDAIGRPIDDTGRLVPFSSLVSRPRYSAEPVERTRVHFYDKKGHSRWRWKETGRLAPKPGMADIRYDSAGRPRDDTGKPIPRKSYRHDILEPGPITEKKRRTVVEQLPTITSHGNRSDGNDLDNVFAEAISGHVAKGPFGLSDIDIYNYGVHIRMDRRLSSDEQRNIREYLGNFEDVKLQFIQEQRVTSFRIIWGDKFEPVLIRDVFMEMKTRKRQLNELLTYFDIDNDYYDWFAFWDTEEGIYE